MNIISCLFTVQKNKHDFFTTNSKKYFTIRLKKIIMKEEDNFQQF